MRFPYRIVRNKRINKVVRTLDLELFHTFKDGTNIYTYKDEDLAQMSSRHYEKLKQDIANVRTYGITKEVMNKYWDAIKDTASKGINNEIKQGDALAQVLEIVNELIRQRDVEIDMQSAMYLDLVCMFFVLDEENELIYSPASNAKKIKLLETCTDEEKELFFSLVKIKLFYYKRTYINAMLSSLQEEITQGNEMASLSNLTEQLASNFMPQDLQE
ncbi:MAG: hypothetical protein GY756_26960 [bacterium]|nr:hypothetical protein [bacterium]